MRARTDIEIGKALSHCLRHAPEEYGLTLAADGSAPISDVVAGLRAHPQYAHVTEADIRRIVAESDKRRYAIEHDTIRAHYGHSLAERISKDAITPTAPLFHATSPSALDVILQDGLRPMKRQYVHLSPEPELALDAARRRHPQPILLHVEPTAAAAAGVVFFEGHERVTLAEFVPAAVLRIVS